MQERFDGVWLNIGVDASIRWLPPAIAPGIGLRPGGERPDLEAWVPLLYTALYESIAAHARLGLNVVVDVDHHEWYSKPLGILPRCARTLEGLPVLFVGVCCPVDVMRQRRRDTWNQSPDDPDFAVPVDRFQSAVHDHGGYDLEVDTSLLSPEGCADVIRERLGAGPPGTAFSALSAR